jgi:hypothetical protein
MLDVSMNQLKEGCDIFIATAAVADYRVAEVAEHKIKKSGDELAVSLVKNPDIVATIAQQQQRPFMVGFAAETQNVEEYAAGKWAQEVVYVYVTGTDWYTIRNSSTGLITGRSIRAVAVLKTTSGKCQWEEVSIKQDYNGAEYGKSQSYGNSSVIVPVDCNTAMKYKQ